MTVRHSWLGIRPATRHSLVLAVAGTVYIFIGLAYVMTDPTDARLSSLVVATNIMPIQGWGVVFMLTGLASVVSSRWPPASETWGYTAMTGVSVAWGGFYLMGIALGLSPLANITGALLWGLMGFLWWAVSGLLNPNGTTATTPPSDEPIEQITPADASPQE